MQFVINLLHHLLMKRFNSRLTIFDRRDTVSSVLHLLSFRAADFDTDHCMVLSEVR
jgi:hypothetical protein